MKFDMPSCGGCRTCELACSFHLLGEFVPSASALKIEDKDDGPGYAVVLKEVADGDGPACDHCVGLETPLCMDYCREYDDLKIILERFRESRSPKNGEKELEGAGNVRR